MRGEGAAFDPGPIATAVRDKRFHAQRLSAHSFGTAGNLLAARTCAKVIDRLYRRVVLKTTDISY
jgi:hypothetical protein